jgi:hypothetical protein
MGRISANINWVKNLEGEKKRRKILGKRKKKERYLKGKILLQ